MVFVSRTTMRPLMWSATKSVFCALTKAQPCGHHISPFFEPCEPAFASSEPSESASFCTRWLPPSTTKSSPPSHATPLLPRSWPGPAPGLPMLCTNSPSGVTICSRRLTESLMHRLPSGMAVMKRGSRYWPCARPDSPKLRSSVNTALTLPTIVTRSEKVLS